MGGYIISEVSSESKDKAIEKDEVKDAIKYEEFRYRDSLSINFKNYINSISLKKIDSLSISNKEYIAIKQFLIQDFLTKQKDKSFNIYSKKQPFLFVSYDSIKTSFKIKKENLQNVIQNINMNGSISDPIKYEGILEIKSKIKAKINYDIIALILGGLFILKLIIDFSIAYKESRKEKITYKDIEGQILDIEDQLTTEEKKEEKDKNNSERIKYLSDLVNELKNKISPLLDKTNSIQDAKLEAYKIERISRQFYERSNLLLSIGFIIAIVGIIIFYLILPEFKTGVSLNEYLAISLRPVLTLIFFQTLSFFIFKLYRISVADYKFFNKEYQEKIAFIVAHKLLKEEGFVENDLSSIKKFIETNKAFTDPDKESIGEESILQQIKSLIKKG